ncbi:hypothetical protein BDY24DRAFT_416149 [Mrakia frigida]|uniref:RlpA-like double-psi beta-barrel domain-containing protein n=1 Tax=Mrakia frigida TaxID=29902 RepID=UPI003FCC0600
MLFPSSSLLLPFLLFLSSSSPSSARRTHGTRSSTNPHLISRSVDSNLTNTRRRMDLASENQRRSELAPVQRPRMDVVVERRRTAQPPAFVKKRQASSGKCKIRSSSSSSTTSSVTPAGTTTSEAAVAPATSSSSSSSSTPILVAAVVQTTTSSPAAVPTTTQAVEVTTTAQVASTTTVAAVADSDWPTQTQAGSVPSATATSASDPYLLSASYALNNADNALFTQTRTGGELTYYAQGQTSCGSVYDDSSYTAAISHLLYDSWPGAGISANRNPICGPFAPGRLSLTSEVLVPSTTGTVLIGGDGLLNCVVGEMCHIPLTATITYGGNSVKVKIVDRCEGCAIEDIDVTPTVFQALTGNMGLGRVTSGLTWSFDSY